MTAPESRPRANDTEQSIWQLMIDQLDEIPRRYQRAQQNQPYAVRMMGSLPLGFDEETVNDLAAGNILRHDIELINLCLEALQGKVSLSLEKLLERPDLPLPIPTQETVASFDGYNPDMDSWRIDLASGNVANLSSHVVRDLIEYRP